MISPCGEHSQPAIDRPRAGQIQVGISGGEVAKAPALALEVAHSVEQLLSDCRLLACRAGLRKQICYGMPLHMKFAGKSVVGEPGADRAQDRIERLQRLP